MLEANKNNLSEFLKNKAKPTIETAEAVTPEVVSGIPKINQATNFMNDIRGLGDAFAGILNSDGTRMILNYLFKGADRKLGQEEHQQAPPVIVSDRLKEIKQKKQEVEKKMDFKKIWQNVRDELDSKVKKNPKMSAKELLEFLDDKVGFIIKVI